MGAEGGLGGAIGKPPIQAMIDNNVKTKRRCKALRAAVWATILIITIIFTTAQLSGCAAAESPAPTLAVFWVPATKDAAEIRTAQYAARALAARWPERPVLAARTDAARKPYTSLSESVITKGMILSGQFADGSEPLARPALVEELAGTVCDVWFLLPEEAAPALCRNGELAAQCEAMLNRPDSALHFVCIGDQGYLPPADSFPAGLAEAGRADWRLLAGDFLATGRSFDQRTVHTGDFFLASLYGTPADLPLTAAGEDTLTFTLPQDGRVLVLTRQEGGQALPAVTDANGSPRGAEELALSFTGKTAVNYTGRYLQGLQAGVYQVSGAGADSTRVCWYPDFAGMNPRLEMADRWFRGEQTLLFRLDQTLGRPWDFVVQFAYSQNGEAPVNRSAVWDPELEGWTDTVHPDAGVTEAAVTPTVLLCMADGNEIWHWEGSTERREIAATPVTLPEAPESLSLYTDSRGGAAEAGRLTFAWSDFFGFNPADEPVLTAEASGTEALAVETAPEGFTLSLKSEAMEGAATAEGAVLLSCAGVARTLTVTCVDVETLRRRVTLSVDQPESVESLPVGAAVSVIASLPPEAAAAWEEAMGQLPSLSGPQQLLLRAGLEGAAEAESQALPLSPQPQGGWQARTDVTLPDTLASGPVTLSAALYCQDGGTPVTETAFPLSVTNTAPVYTGPAELPAEIALSGWPWAPVEQELLTALLGTDQPGTLFTDPETGVATVYIKVQGLAGLALPALPEGAEARLADENTWEATLPSPETSAGMTVSGAGEHTIWLVASDGVNASPAWKGETRVYVRSLRILSYAGAVCGALLLLALAVLVIRQARRPSFAHVQLRCLQTPEEDPSRNREWLNRGRVVSLAPYGKKALPLNLLLVLSRQPALPRSLAEAAEDIRLIPARHDAVTLVFGKAAMKTLGRQRRKETVAQDAVYRLWLGDTCLLIENLQN